jgi:peptide/nickel transport system substrate-binding protein
MPKHVLEKETDISKSEYSRKPVGTGPFVVTDFKAGDSITVERNPNYRKKGQPYLDKIIFRSVPSREVAVAQLKAGEVQGMWNLLEAQTPELEKDTSIKLEIVQAPGVERVELNTAENKEGTDPTSVHPVLGDINLRRALIYATPKQQIIDKLLYGKARPGSSPVAQGPFSPKVAQEGYDPKKASELLDQSGWVKGSDGIRSKGGVRASISITTTTGDAIRERVEQVLADEYKQIGVELKISNMPSSVLLSASWSSGDPRKHGVFDMVMYNSTPDVDPHSTVNLRYHSKNIPWPGNGGAGQNYTRFKNAEADKAIDEAGSTLDVEKRKAAYTKALQLLNDAAVVIWLYERGSINAFRTNVFGYAGQVWDNITWNVQDWYMKGAAQSY